MVLPLVEFKSIQTRLRGLTPRVMGLHPLVWNLFATFNKVHACWRWLRRAELHIQPDNTLPLAVGYFADFMTNSIPVRVAAHSLLIITRLIQCAKQRDKVIHTCQQWKLAIRGCYPQPIHVRWEKHVSTIGLPASWTYEIEKVSLKSYHYMYRVIIATCMVFLQTFKLSMILMDAIDAICMHSSAKEDSMKELVININICMEHFENRETLIENMKENEQWFTRLLGNEYQRLSASITVALATASAVTQVFRTANTCSAGIIGQFANKLKKSIVEWLSPQAKERRYEAKEYPFSELHQNPCSFNLNEF